MDIEEYKKFIKDKINSDNLTNKVRNFIQEVKWKKQDMREGFTETFNPLIKSQEGIKKSIDEQQNKTSEQLQANQLALTDGLNRNRLAITQGLQNLNLVASTPTTSTPTTSTPTTSTSTPKTTTITPDYFDQYLNNKETYDVLQKNGYDKLPSFYYDKDISNLISVINSVNDKISNLQNIHLINTADFKQQSNYGFTEAIPKNQNPRKETLNKINTYNKLSSYLSQLNKLYAFKSQFTPTTYGSGINLYNSIPKIIKRLELLAASINAGNNGVINEFSEIAHLLKQMNVISNQQLNDLLKTYINK